MALSVNVREMLRSDVVKVFKLMKQLDKDNEKQTSMLLHDFERVGFDKDPASYHGVVALKGVDEIVGVVLYHCKYSTWEGPVMHLNTFVVAENCRRQGVGTQLLKKLAKIANEKKYSRISLEVPGGDAQLFFDKHKACNLSKEEEWLNYFFDKKAVNEILEMVHENSVQGTLVRATEPRDCEKIRDMIQELADFEKMADGPKINAKDIQRDGFYKLHPEFYSFVAESSRESEEKELIGFCIFCLTFSPVGGPRVHLEDLYVTPKHRGKGVGKLLFRAVGQFVKEGGYDGFTLEVLGWNEKAIQFYDKFSGKNMTSGPTPLQSYRFKKQDIQRLLTS